MELNEASGTYGVWHNDGEGDRYTDNNGQTGFSYEAACQHAQRIGGGARQVNAQPPLERATEKIQITQPDWDMSDWPAAELTVESFVMPLEACGDNDDPAAVVDAYGRALRIVGVRRAGDRVELVVDTEGPDR